MNRRYLFTGLFLFAIASGSVASPNITAYVDGVPYVCGPQSPPPPDYILYCSCQTLFGQTSLNLIAVNPQAGEEKKVRELAKFSGTAVHPGMEQCRAAVKAQEYVECLQ